MVALNGLANVPVTWNQRQRQRAEPSRDAGLVITLSSPHIKFDQQISDTKLNLPEMPGL